MNDREATTVEFELVNRMPSGLPFFAVNLARAVADQLVDYVLKEAEYAVPGNADRLVHAARLDDRGRRAIELKNGEGMFCQPRSGARVFGSPGFQEGSQDWGMGLGVAGAVADAFWRSWISIVRSFPGLTGFLNSAPSRPRRRERFSM